METLQHADLLEYRQHPPIATLADAREAARQLAGPCAEIVHRYLARADLLPGITPPTEQELTAVWVTCGSPAEFGLKVLARWGT
jgi:hypothetical protein